MRAVVVEADVVVDAEIVALAGHASCRRRGRAGACTAGRSSRAPSAAIAAHCAAWLSLPPKPPPMRRTSTVTASTGTSEHVRRRCAAPRSDAGSRNGPACRRPRPGWRARPGLRDRNAPARRCAARPVTRCGARGERGRAVAAAERVVAAGRRLSAASASSTSTTQCVPAAMLDLRELRGARAPASRVSATTANSDLPVELDRAVGEERIVVQHRADVVLAGNVRGGQHRDDAGRGAHRVEVDAEQSARARPARRRPRCAACRPARGCRR